MAEERNVRVQEYKEKVVAQAEEMVFKNFPKQIVELEMLLKTETFTRTDLKTIHTELNIPIPDASIFNHDNEVQSTGKKRKHIFLGNDIQGCKVLVLPNGSVPCNRHVVEIVDIVKPRIKQLVEDSNMLKMWIQFLIPRIEDGNNFGVSIQEDTLSEIRTVEGEAGAYLDQISRYFLTRGKILSKVAKYPHVDDFRRTVHELDEKQYVSLRLVLCELRNHYATLHDMITKNLEKIKKPRSSNNETMY